MKPPVRSVYTPSDFEQWRAANGLLLTPKFQRRGVWKPAARSFFLDTLLRGMPVPPIYIRQTQSEKKDRIIREVVDGQQRVSAVLDFMSGEFRLSKGLNAPWAGKTYEQLSPADQDQISTFPFSAEVFHGVSDLEVLEIFARLNTYSVPLNAQELRNGRYFGSFKQSAYALAYEHLEFWRRHKVFTEQNIARMLEVEFVSEVLIAFLAGMQDKKKSIDSFYEQNEEAFPQQSLLEKRFQETVDELEKSLADHLADTAFRRPPLLYSLFCVVYHRRYGLPGASLPTPKKPLSRDERLSLLETVQNLSSKIDQARDGEEVPPTYSGFVTASLQQTDNIRPRSARLATIYKATFG